MSLYVYRCGLSFWSYSCNVPWIISHTVVCDGPEDSSTHATLFLFANDLNNMFGVGGEPAIFSNMAFIDELHPHAHLLSRSGGYPTYTDSLNPNAPEACFRLRRVGAAGSIGRILVPIPHDDYFEDLPKRRRIIPTTFQEELDANLGSRPKVRYESGRTYTLAIVHRRDLTWDPVDHYEILPTTVRRWQRWRKYVPKPIGYWGADQIPDELDDVLIPRG